LRPIDGHPTNEWGIRLKPSEEVNTMPRTSPIKGAGTWRLRGWTRAALAVLLVALAGQPATAATVKSQNLVDLIQHSDRIIIGTVVTVIDGFDDNDVPFTEVTLRVAESIRGDEAETVTFRQFGLQAPRQINGKTYLGVTPQGWPTWNEQERVMLFLHRPAQLTGLQTTVGLGQGKLQMLDGQLSNGAGNVGLFQNMKVEARGLSGAQLAMLDTDGEAIDANPFISLVRRAVQESWVEKGVLHHEN
jgi:hypothetical protein